MKFSLASLAIVLLILTGYLRRDNSTFLKSNKMFSDTLTCGNLDRDSLEFINLPYYDNNEYLEEFLDSINYPSDNDNLRFAYHPTLVWIPVKFHIIRYSNGVGVIDTNRVRTLIDNLNTTFRVNNTYIQFYQSCGVEYIDNSDYMTFSNSEFLTLAANYFQPGKMNVFLTKETEGVRGFSTRMNTSGAVTIGENAAESSAASSIFSHEVGHFLGLDHTDQYSDRSRCLKEPIDRTRTYNLISFCKPFGSRVMCESTGDGLKDTPADPGLEDNESCSYILGNYDFFGDSYANPPSGSESPSPANLMSTNKYAYCRTEFTRRQVAVMLVNAMYGGPTQWKDPISMFDDYEPDNRLDDADTIPYCGSQSRNFHAQYGLSPAQSCDDDWVEYVATQSGNVDIFTNGIVGKPSVNTILNVYNTSNTLIATNDDKSGTSIYSKVTINATLGATYLIKVTNKYPTTIGYYQLGVGSDLNGPTVSGNAYLCNIENYSMSSLPSGASVSWSISPSWAASLTTSGNVATLTKTTLQVFTLTGVITSSCGSSSPINKTITSANSLAVVEGTYNTPSGYVPLVPSVKFSFLANDACMSTQTNMVVPFGSTITWSGPANTWDLNWVQSINDVTIYFTALNQEISLSATITGPCGSKGTNFRFKCTTTSHCGITPLRMAMSSGEDKAVVIYPNPASNELIVHFPESLDQRTDMETLSRKMALSKFDYKLFNNNGKLIKSENNISTSKKLSINVGDIPNGQYFMHVIQGKNVLKKQIIVNH
ncbi:zinc-dependent metalloprotease [Pedobacter psychroterrae]|uniref:T9SS type A sorting domain-containing protein n=1 Tax=Pedobacter psychroterrae TaxID=2530453 RepID=A0A4R0NKB9_9SPHI|nr:zinc-dependent metalloprotease [Pedobacter psychroterrae]TCC99932.1 T9SS type A sorting domain-containing protein [Pedobacter psychroterrae]